MGTVALVGLGADGRDARWPRSLGRRRHRAAAGRPVAGAAAPGSRCRCWPPPGSCCWRPAGATPSRGGCRAGLAEAVAVPAAAQLACTPVVAALSGQVSLVAVARQPARRPGGRAGHRARAWPGGAGRPGLGAAGPAARARWPAGAWRWIVAVARARRRPAAAGGRLGDRAAGALAVPDRALRRRRAGAPGGAAPARSPGSACCAVLAGRAWWSGRPRPGWPPAGWVLAACDVGQGDALVLRAGPGRGGRGRRRPRSRRRSTGCLRRLEVDAGAAAGAHPLPRRPRRRAGRACSTAAASARSR